ncbi:MAG: transaldolase [Candidatus Omnitrophica bacterium]|nr:transaldolase [Candidatus Omnitrophota bacterium]
MPKTNIEELNLFGQSVWLDNISRSLIESGKLKSLIAKGLRGMTSNPTIFDKAISNSDDYDQKIRQLSFEARSTFEIYDALTIADIQEAADIFRPVYDETDAQDGYVSLEINPELAARPKETIEEGKRLHGIVNRANVMLKVPATDAGFEAIEELLASGININATLIFSLGQYIKTAQAYLRGLRRLSADCGDLSRIVSVASVFVSRVDTKVDKMLDERIAEESDDSVKKRLQALKGKAAVANSAIIFGKYLEIFSDSEFKELEKKGAKVQRALWASTSTKNPAYNDIKYVSELIARDTVNTLPDNTFDAFLEHGVVKQALTADITLVQAVIDDLRCFDIDIDSVCTKLLQDGVVAFENSFRSLLGSLEDKTKRVCVK